MNAVKTAAHQIKTFGTLKRTIKHRSAIFHQMDVYRIDTVTDGIIITDNRGHVRQVTFEYAMR